MNAAVLAAALRVRTLQARLAARALADAGRAETTQRQRDQAGRQRLHAELRAWHDGLPGPGPPASSWLPAALAEAARVQHDVRCAEQQTGAARRDTLRAMRDQEVVEAALARARLAARARAGQRALEECQDAGRARSLVRR